MTRNNSVTKQLLEGKEHHTEITLKNKAESMAEIGNYRLERVQQNKFSTMIQRRETRML